jgi:hypothetical protein
MEQKLEQILKTESKIGKQDMNNTIDVYATETTALFTPPAEPMNRYGMHSGPTTPMFNPMDTARRTERGLGLNNPIGSQTTLPDYGFQRNEFKPPEIAKPEPFKIYNLPSGSQVHLHNDCEAGNIQIYCVIICAY